MKKSLKTLLILCVCVLSAVCCAAIAGCNTDYSTVYDDNAKIISLNGNYSAMGRVRNVHNGSAKISCMSFSGVDTLYTRFDVDGGTSANLTVNYTGEEGKLKVVLTDSNNVYVLKEVGFIDENTYVDGYSGAVNFGNIPQGRYKLKIVGVKAEFTFELNF